ncbi:MAG: DUF2357 domain-containing protein (plasmid) [Candidatus Methanoperedens sp.]|nr:MAG: DUF2357 domain-containing protein [Candidatus Methanoperedens sp.]
MDTQTSTNDWALKIESKGFSHTYWRNELDEIKILCVDHRFAETEEIKLTYRLDENEKTCKLFIPNYDIKREYTEDKSVFTYCWTPLNFAGIFETVFKIKTKDNRDKNYTLHLDVLSKFDKGGNNQYFHYMLNSIRRKHLDIYCVLNPSSIQKDKIEKFSKDPCEQFKVHKDNMKELENIVYQISLNPNKKLIKETRRDSFYALDMVDPNVIFDIAIQRGRLIKAPNSSIAPELQKLLNGHLPDTIPVYRTAPTFNVFENQLLKRFLTLITICSKLVEKRFEDDCKDEFEHEKIEQYQRYIRDCKEFHRKVQFMKRYSFLDDVSETDNIAYHTPVLQREVNYMRFHDIFKDFIKMPFFDFSESLTLPILEIPVLYEYWSVLQIIDILCNMNDWKKDEHFIEKNEFGYLIKLRTGSKPLIELSSDDDEKYICLFYQKTYKTYARRDLRPDITLEMHINGKLSRILVLDPKYRTELGAKDSNDPESAINKMHVHKDAIRGEDGNHIVEAACAIYLGETKKYCSQDSNDGIGGINLFPTENDAKGKEMLKEIIQNFIRDTRI